MVGRLVAAGRIQKLTDVCMCSVHLWWLTAGHVLVLLMAAMTLTSISLRVKKPVDVFLRNSQSSLFTGMTHAHVTRSRQPRRHGCQMGVRMATIPRRLIQKALTSHSVNVHEFSRHVHGVFTASRFLQVLGLRDKCIHSHLTHASHMTILMCKYVQLMPDISHMHPT